MELLRSTSSASLAPKATLVSDCSGLGRVCNSSQGNSDASHLQLSSRAVFLSFPNCTNSSRLVCYSTAVAGTYSDFASYTNPHSNPQQPSNGSTQYSGNSNTSSSRSFLDALITNVQSAVSSTLHSSNSSGSSNNTGSNNKGSNGTSGSNNNGRLFAAVAASAGRSAAQGTAAASQSAIEAAAVGELKSSDQSSKSVMAAAVATGGGGPVEWWQQLTGGGGGGGGGAGGGGAASRPKEVILTLASFAVTKLAYVRLTKRFREEYLKETGIDVRFRLAFAGSGVQARAVIDGLPADIVALALPLDIEYIVTAGLIAANWPTRYPNKSVVCETTAALVVRPGNPKNIMSWEDLLKPGVKVVMANPKTAGVARWIFLALWGHRMKQGDAAATAYVTAVMENVVVQPRDAREASDVFYKQKVGDVLLTYENEVTLTNEVYGDAALPYVVPTRNIRIECPVSMVDGVVERRGKDVVEAAKSFLSFLFTSPAQREFAKVGFRANAKVSKEVAKQQIGLPPTRMWEVDRELGGWAAAQAKFFNAGCILDQIQTEVGLRKAAERARVAAAKKG